MRTARESVGLEEFEELEDHVNHCVHDALAAGDAKTAQAKRTELLAAVERFAKTT